MATAYFSGDYTSQYNNGTPYYPGQHQFLNNQNYNMNPSYGNDYQTQRFMNQNNLISPQQYNMNQLYQSYMNNSSYPNNCASNYGNAQQGLREQYHQTTSQPLEKSEPSQQKHLNQEAPLEIRGGVIISSCHCSKKNGLQDHCGRYVCRVENENKRLRKIWQDYPTKDTNVDVSHKTDANKLIINPAYNQPFGDTVVSSNAEPVPVSYNYNM